ncbi:MAG: LptF/LptG family permease [Fibrobacterota bacterium]|nr:LptF/LptG family permease [Chitinispirillaceae bacterium]
MILYRYIIKEHIFPFLASLSIIVFLFAMQYAMYLLPKIISKGLDPAVVLETFLIQLAWILALAIPMAILTSTLMTFGRMSGDNEITAIKASGHNLMLLMIPVIVASTAIGVFLTFFNDLILPDANHKAANLISDISRKKPAAFIEPGIIIRDFTGYTIYTEDVDPKSGTLKGIKIFSNLSGQDPSFTMADSGKIQITPDQQYLEFTLFKGESHSTSRTNKDDYFFGRFEKQVVSIKNVDSELQRTNSNYRGDREKSSLIMLDNIREFKEANKPYEKEYEKLLDSLKTVLHRFDSLAQKYVSKDTASSDSLTFSSWLDKVEPSRPIAIGNVELHGNLFDRIYRRIHSNNLLIAQHMVEVHKKYAIPFACILFVLIGAPLGIMAKRGGLGVGASYSLLFFIITWAFLMKGEVMADKLQISPFLAMWSGNILVAVCGVILTTLMLREKTIRFDWIVNGFKHIFALGKQKRKHTANRPSLPLLVILMWIPRWFSRKFIGTAPTYLIGSFLTFTIGLQLALVFTYVTIDYVSNARKFEGIPFERLAYYYYYSLPWIVQVTIPIVLLLASMFSIGKMARSSELTAVKASGMSVRQLTFPLLLLGILLSVGIFYGSEEILPKANSLKRELEDKWRDPVITKNSPNTTVKEYRRDFYYFANNKTLYYYDEFSTSPFFVRNVQRQIYNGSSVVQSINADASDFRDSTGWRFINAEIRDFTKEPISVTRKDTLIDSILTAKPVVMVARIKNKDEMSYWELRSFIESAKKRGEEVEKYLGDLEFKIAFPFMNFIVILLGISITARMGRKGGALLFGLGLAIAFSYWIISRFAIVFAQNGHMPVLLGAWFGNILFFLLGLVLYRKASR